ncbi:PBS lyase [Geomonas limicola]|uniref:PBS lyase n=1 Tax=Geomonas limicola TaxID=2740186 RepID=A0A6V8NE07_9BACT|nr:hypothetical protein [Geomonas limicola]GFO69349.1 PBS lyase [Geomonas limicola]
MTNHTTLESPDDHVTVRTLATLIHELNISRRNIRAYPPGHQVIVSGLGKVLTTYGTLTMPAGEIVLGVSGDALLWQEDPLDKSNRVFRDFARALHERSIAALTLRPGLTGDELERFIGILATSREEIYQQGGIESVWDKTGIAALGIRVVRYDIFTSTAPGLPDQPQGTAQPTLWEQFARGAVRGLFDQGAAGVEALDPQLLAQDMNREFLQGVNFEAQAREFAGYLVRRDIFGTSRGFAEDSAANPAFRALATFVSSLTPALRRQFLNASFDLNRQGASAAASALLRELPRDVVLEVLEEVNANQTSVPPFILGMLQQLAGLGQPGALTGSQDSEQALQEKMRILLREHAMEEYIPESYQEKLGRMLELEQIPLLGSAGLDGLLETMEVASLESRTGDILLLLLHDDAAGDADHEALAQNLKEICGFFQQTGAYEELLKVLRQLKTHGAQGPGLLAEIFGERDFVEELLEGLGVWGKEKFEVVTHLVQEIGPACIPPLLDRLAVEQGMSLRRFLMDRLVEFGPVAAPALAARLGDGPWYYLRNLIGVVRQSQLTECVERLRPLARHRDGRVAQEALRTLLQFRDPDTETRVMNGLESPDRGTQLFCLGLAGKSAAPAMLGKLHRLLAAPGFGARDCELKSAVLPALAEIGTTDALRVLEELFAARSLLHPIQLNKLKMEALATLARYPAAPCRALLKRLAQGRGSVARQAAQLLSSLPGRLA